MRELADGWMLHLKRLLKVESGNDVLSSLGRMCIIIPRRALRWARLPWMMYVSAMVPMETRVMGLGCVISLMVDMGRPLTISCWNVRVFGSPWNEEGIAVVRSTGQD